MRKRDKALIILYTFLVSFTIAITNQKCNHEEQPIEDEIIQADSNELERDWNTFINAIVWKESKGKWDAVGKKNDVGVLQIVPICLLEANRLLGYDKFTLNDRLDSIKSVEIFNTIQGFYNPEHDKHLALKIWNPRAKLSYHTDIMNKYYELKENNK